MNEIQQLTAENNALRIQVRDLTTEVEGLRGYVAACDRVIRQHLETERKLEAVIDNCICGSNDSECPCVFCGDYIHADSHGSWIDNTDGDTCTGHPETGANENEPHTPGLRYGMNPENIDKKHGDMCRMPSCPTCNGMDE
jgi:hypothetical protein